MPKTLQAIVVVLVALSASAAAHAQTPVNPSAAAAVATSPGFVGASLAPVAERVMKPMAIETDVAQQERPADTKTRTVAGSGSSGMSFSTNLMLTAIGGFASWSFLMALLSEEPAGAAFSSFTGGSLLGGFLVVDWIAVMLAQLFTGADAGAITEAKLIACFVGSCTVAFGYLGAQYAFSSEQKPVASPAKAPRRT